MDRYPPKRQSLRPTPRIVGIGFGKRALAFLIDLIVLFLSDRAIGYIVGLLAGVVLHAAQANPHLNERNFRLLDLAHTPIMFLGYFTSFEWLYGATVGKFFLDMRVLRLNGKPCDIRAALVRSLYRFADGLLFAVAVSRMQPPLHLRSGDKAAKTIVITTSMVPHESHRPARSFSLAYGLFFTFDFLLWAALTFLILR